MTTYGYGSRVLEVRQLLLISPINKLNMVLPEAVRCLISVYTTTVILQMCAGFDCHFTEPSANERKARRSSRRNSAD